MNQIKFISDVNQKSTKSGFFVVKNVGKLFQNIVGILMVAQGS